MIEAIAAEVVQEDNLRKNSADSMRRSTQCSKSTESNQ